MRIPPKKKIMIFFISCIIAIFAVFCFLAFTGKGSLIIASFGLKHYTEIKQLDVGTTQGNLAQGVTYYDLELSNIKNLPQDSIVKIQQLDISLDALNVAGLNVAVKNGRIFLKGIDTVLAYGSLQSNNLDAVVYCRQIPVRALITLLPWIKNVKDVSGVIEDFDIKIKGDVLNPGISGSLYIRELKWNQFVMKNCPVIVDLGFKNIPKDIEIKGVIDFKSGEIFGRKTALLKLQESSIVFAKDPLRPSMRISGTAVVEKTKISVLVKGEVDAPEIILNSEPVLAKDKLIVMLATNQSWEGVSGSLETSQISPEMSSDLLNYFIFGTAGRKIARLLGVDSVSLKYDGKTREAEITKEISGSTGIKYGVEQKINKQENEPITQKVAIDQKISKSVYLEAEKKLDNPEKEKIKDNGETNLWLKFKKQF